MFSFLFRFLLRFSPTQVAQVYFAILLISCFIYSRWSGFCSSSRWCHFAVSSLGSGGRTDFNSTSQTAAGSRQRLLFCSRVKSPSKRWGSYWRGSWLLLLNISFYLFVYFIKAKRTYACLYKHNHSQSMRKTAHMAFLMFWNQTQWVRCGSHHFMSLLQMYVFILSCLILLSAFNGTIIYQMNIIIYLIKLKTSKWNHKIISKVCIQIINHSRIRLNYPQTSIQTDFKPELSPPVGH